MEADICTGIPWSRWGGGWGRQGANPVCRSAWSGRPCRRRKCFAWKIINGAIIKYWDRYLYWHPLEQMRRWLKTAWSQPSVQVSMIRKAIQVARMFCLEIINGTIINHGGWYLYPHPLEQMRRWLRTAGSQPSVQVNIIRKVTRAARMFCLKSNTFFYHLFLQDPKIIHFLWNQTILFLKKGHLMVNRMHRAKGKGYHSMDTPCSQPSYSGRYHSPESLIYLRTG